MALRNLSGVDALRGRIGSFAVSLGVSSAISGSRFDWKLRGESLSRDERRDRRLLAMALALMARWPGW